MILINIKQAGQQIPAMTDSGANPNCISLRCVRGSKELKYLPRIPHSGKDIVDANGRILEPQFVINCEVAFGNPLSVISEVHNFSRISKTALVFGVKVGQHGSQKWSKHAQFLRN